MGLKIGIDVGGTFTDLVAVNEKNEFFVGKTVSTPKNQTQGIIAGLNKIAQHYQLTLEDLLSQMESLIHGTTVGTNIMLEYDGACVGIITTKGFRDEIEIRRGWREDIHDVKLPPPFPIAPRRRRVTVYERVDYQGKIVTPLDEAEVRQAIASLRKMGANAIAVCFLHSYANPQHENRALELIREEYPDAYAIASNHILPQIREFERFSTTMVSAFIGPKLKQYLLDLESSLKRLGFNGQLMIMQSTGGVMTVDYISQKAIYALGSGPAGGVAATINLGRATGYKDIISVDMGGTSYDITLIKDLHPQVSPGHWEGRHRVAIPMIDIHSIGAGGGSIAWVDAGGALRVGPKSAKAEPGPACYGQGGAEPTVTDADLVLGYLNPEFFLGGEIHLKKELALKSIAEKVAHPLGMDITEAAVGIFRIVNANMADGIRVVSVQRGYDPRDFVLFAFGGAGPVHAGVQAEDLHIPLVVVPKWAGAFCALGDLISDMTVTEVKTFISRTSSIDLNRVNEILTTMIESGLAQLPSRGITGMDIRRYGDFRYAGEVHEVSVPIRGRARRVSEYNFRATVSDFHNQHEKLYGYKDLSCPVEIINLKVEVVGITDKPRLPESAYVGEDASPGLKGKRPVFFQKLKGFVDTPVYDGNLLKYGNIIQGPAIIEEPQTTVVVYPNQEAMVDIYSNYLIEIQL